MELLPQVNFELKNNYALIYRRRLIDLHNNFDFERLEYDIVEHALVLTFKKRRDEWVSQDECEKVVLIHKQVSYLVMSDRDQAYPFTSDMTLESVTFFPSTVRDMHDSIHAASLPTGTDDLIYWFESDYYVRVGCEEVEVMCS